MKRMTPLLFAVEHLLEGVGEAHAAAGRGRGGFRFLDGRQVAEQCDARWRGSEKHSLLLVRHNVDCLALSQGPDFEHVEPGCSAPADGQSLPIAKQPDAAEENSNHHN